MGRGYGDSGNGARHENSQRWLALHVADGFVLVASARQNGRSRDPSGIGQDTSCGEGAVQRCRAGFRASYKSRRLALGQSHRQCPSDTKAGLAELIRGRFTLFAFL